MVSASRALLGTHPAPLGPPWVSPPTPATSGPPQPCPPLHPAWSLVTLGGARGLSPIPPAEGTVFPSLGTGLAEALGWVWGAGAGVPQDRVGPARGWGWLCADRERFGFCCGCCGTQGTNLCSHWCCWSQHWWCWWGRGVAATRPRPGGTLWVLVAMVRLCRGQGLQGGLLPLLEVALEAEEEDESSQN